MRRNQHAPGLQRKTFLYLIEPQMPESRRLAENVDSFCWLPDGRWAVVSSGRMGERRLLLVDAETGESRTLVQDRDVSQPMFWSGRPL